MYGITDIILFSFFSYLPDDTLKEYKLQKKKLFILL